MFFSELMQKHKEIKYYKSLPVIFNGFLRAEGFSDGNVALACVERRPGDIIRGYAPSYFFEIRVGGERVGAISLRVGYSRSLYYSGQIGYAVDAPYRGRGYAGAACRLMIPLMLSHGMYKVLITNNCDNAASRRVCEKLGARRLRAAKIPRWHEMYDSGERRKNIFEWDVAKAAETASDSAANFTDLK